MTRPPVRGRTKPSTASSMSEAESRAWAAATAALDRVAVDLERTWGVNRLPELVPADLAARFATAQEQCDMEIAAGDIEAAAQKAAALARGWKALDAAARAAGHQPNDLGAVWTASVEGQAFAVCLHTADVGATTDRYPGHTAVALQELLAREAAIYRKAKTIWPGAAITAARPASTKPPANWKAGDDLPF
jgi:hypothetical protein